MGISSLRVRTGAAGARPHGRSLFLTLPPLGFYALAAAMVITTHTLHGRLNSLATYCMLGIVVLMFALIVRRWATAPISRAAMSHWTMWVALLMAVFGSLVLYHGGWGDNSHYPLFFTIAALTPGCAYLLRKGGELDALLRAFVNIMVFLTVVGTALWLLGPMLGLIQRTGTIENTWNGSGRVFQSHGYFGLLFLVQDADLSSVGIPVRIFRNTSIFTEAPVYSFALSVAVIFEAFVTRQRRPFAMAVLAIGIITSTALTGYVLLLLTWLDLSGAMDKAKGKRSINPIAVFAILVIAVWVFSELVLERASSLRGSTRLDDYAAAFRAWMDNPLFGNGLNNTNAIRRHMSSYRANNLGFSNSPGNIIAQGGLLLLLPYAYAFIGLFTGRERIVSRMGSLLFIYLWIMTTVAFIPVTAFMLGLGVAQRMCAAEEERIASEAVPAYGGARA